VDAREVLEAAVVRDLVLADLDHAREGLAQGGELGRPQQLDVLPMAKQRLPRPSRMMGVGDGRGVHPTRPRSTSVVPTEPNISMRVRTRVNKSGQALLGRTPSSRRDR